MARHLVTAPNRGSAGVSEASSPSSLVLAIAALVFAYVLVREVLAADQGTPKMQEIAKAVQEGAAAYLNRQFRTLAVFSVIVFILLLVLPVNDGGFSVQLGRALFFLVGAVFSAAVGYIGMTLATRANVRVAAAAPRAAAPSAASTIAFRTGGVVRHAHRRPRPARRLASCCSSTSQNAPDGARGLRLRRAPCSRCSCGSAAASSPRPPTSAPTWSARSSRASPRTTRATPPPSPTTSATTSATAPAWPPTCSSPTR